MRTINSDSPKEIVVGVDASRNRSGGARAHLLGIIRDFDDSIGVRAVHVWAYQSLLDDIPDRPWLIKHHHPFLERSLGFQLFWQAFSLRRAVRRVGCDILFATDASTLCYFSPLVVLSQDLLSYEQGVMQSYRWGRARLRLEIIKIIQNLAFRRSKGVLFLTEYASGLIQRSCGKLSQTTLVPHGIDESFMRAGEHKQMSSNRGKAEIIRCIYVSNADLYKHQWTVVEAIRQLRDEGFAIELLLIGGGAGLGQAKLIDAMARCDPEGQFVTQLDFVRHSDLPSYLSAADIFIFASSCENLPITLLEGMAVGLPIACSDRGPMPEVLQDAGVYFDPENSTAIAAAVRRLIVSEDLRKQLSKKARRLALAYSWENCSRQTFGFIRKLINTIKE